MPSLNYFNKNEKKHNYNQTSHCNYMWRFTEGLSLFLTLNYKVLRLNVQWAKGSRQALMSLSDCS